MRIDIYADGVCLGDPDGYGGWAVVCEAQDGRKKELSGSSSATDSGRMDLTAVIQGLRLLNSWNLNKEPQPLSVTLHADPTYPFVEGLHDLDGWQRNGWKNADGTDLRNAKFWQNIDAGLQAAKRSGHDIAWELDGDSHSSPARERANLLAGVAAERQQSALDGLGDVPAGSKEDGPGFTDIRSGHDLAYTKTWEYLQPYMTAVLGTVSMMMKATTGIDPVREPERGGDEEFKLSLDWARHENDPGAVGMDVILVDSQVQEGEDEGFDIMVELQGYGGFYIASYSFSGESEERRYTYDVDVLRQRLASAAKDASDFVESLCSYMNGSSRSRPSIHVHG